METLGTPLNDIRKHGQRTKIYPWKKFKQESDLVASSYKRLEWEKRAYRMYDCANELTFNRYDDGSKKLVKAKFCRQRYCPQCSKRRSLKTFGQMTQIFEVMEKNPNYHYEFLTLTQRNCKGWDLKEEIEKIQNAFRTMFKQRELNGYNKDKNGIVKGYFKALEITYNQQDDTYHPHLHAILVFDGKPHAKYGKITYWQAQWKKYMKLDYSPIVHVEAFRLYDKDKEYHKGLAELAKYSTKPDDYILEQNTQQMDATLAVLTTATLHKRMFSMAGVLKEIHKQLNFDDSETGNLVDTNSGEQYDNALNFIKQVFMYSQLKKDYLLTQKK